MLEMTVGVKLITKKLGATKHPVFDENVGRCAHSDRKYISAVHYFEKAICNYFMPYYVEHERWV